MSARLIIICCTWLTAAAVLAEDTPVKFENAAMRSQYDTLLEELRCLVCQNQSLADSHAELAQDLRDEVYKMVTAGRDSDDIREFMVARYGDFVLYKPPVKSTTWLLWFGPLLLLTIGVALVVMVARVRSSRVEELSAEEKARASAILDKR